MNRSSSGCRLSRRSALRLLLAGGIGSLSVRRGRATSVEIIPVHGIVYAVDATDGTERWQTTTANVTGQPVVTDNAVYTISSRAVRALDRTSGETRWQLDDGTPEPWEHAWKQLPPRIVERDGTIYVNAGTLYALESDGSTKWEYDLVDEESVTPVVTDGVVIACRNTNENGGPEQYELIALDAETGTVVWSVERENQISTKPIVADGVVYIDQSFEASVSAYDLETGDPRDIDAPAEVQEGNDDAASRSGSAGSRFTVDGTVVEALEDGEVQWSFDTDDIQEIDTGPRELWSREWIVHEPVVDGDTVFIGCVQWDETYLPPPEPSDDIEADTDTGAPTNNSDTTSNDSDTTPNNSTGTTTTDESPLGLGTVMAGVVGLGVVVRRLLRSETE